MEKLLLLAFRHCILQLLYSERKREQDKSYGDGLAPRDGTPSLEIRIELETETEKDRERRRLAGLLSCNYDTSKGLGELLFEWVSRRITSTDPHT